MKWKLKKKPSIGDKQKNLVFAYLPVKVKAKDGTEYRIWLEPYWEEVMWCGDRDFWLGYYEQWRVIGNTID